MIFNLGDGVQLVPTQYNTITWLSEKSYLKREKRKGTYLHTHTDRERGISIQQLHY